MEWNNSVDRHRRWRTTERVGKSKEMCEKVGISRKCASSQAEDRLMN